MPDIDDRDRQIGALRERLSRLSEASLRINESLDLETVLQGALDSARDLTEARYGVIIILDDSGTVQNFLSSGMSKEDAEWLSDFPGGPEMFQYLTQVSAPTRLRDFGAHMLSQGLPEFSPPMPVSPAISYLGAPIRYRDERIGRIYLGEKEGGREFTDEDEETLLMFAAQTALVISNARQHREEQRARADLEALVDTSPVAVVVFDARAGRPASFNREARRIAELLITAEQSPEDLLGVLTVRRGDGREVSLQEFPIAETLRAGENVRLEEIVLSVPDGRSVSALMNVTSLRSEEGDVESVVVTLQDLTPLEETERLRAEFLAMVSHELRTPLAAIKGSAATAVDSRVSLEPAEMSQFFRIIEQQADRMSGLIADLLDVARIASGSLSVKPTAVSVDELVDEARSTYLSADGSHSPLIELPPDLPHVMADRRRVVQVLINLLSNAARHSPDSALIRMTAERRGLHVAISVTDHGRGIPSDRLPHLFGKFSGHEGQETDTGLGLAICKGIVEAHGGRIWAESDGPGLGARFTFTLPLADSFPALVQGAVSALPGAVPEGHVAQPHVLVIDDDPHTLRYVREVLTREGYSLSVTADPDQVPRLMDEEEPHLVLMDLMLPGTTGIDLMRNVRSLSEIPVIFLSAYGQDQVIANAFAAGAADYVVKPFSPTELIARIQAALRRQNAPPGEAASAEPFALGALSIDYAMRRVTVAGQAIELTNIEYGVLAELSTNAGRILTNEQLMRQVWGRNVPRDAAALRAIIRRLRRKLGDDASDPTYIFNRRGAGYWMNRNP